MIEAIDNLGIALFFGSKSAFLDHLALTVTNAVVWIPMFIALFLLIIKNNDNMKQILLCISCIALMMALAAGVTNIIVKPLVERIRPCNVLELKYMVQIAGDYHAKDYSFFSSHAANTMAVTLFFVLLVRNRVLSSALFVWYLLSVWSRLYLGQHYLTDILVGTVWGIISAFVGYTVYRKLYRNIGGKRDYISTQYTSTGYAIIDIDIVISVFFLILIYAIFPI